MAVATRSLDGITGFVRVLGLGLCIYIYIYTYVSLSLSLRQFFRYTLQFARLCSSCRSFKHYQRREVEVVSTQHLQVSRYVVGGESWTNKKKNERQREHEVQQLPDSHRRLQRLLLSKKFLFSADHKTLYSLASSVLQDI